MYKSEAVAYSNTNSKIWFTLHIFDESTSSPKPSMNPQPGLLAHSQGRNYSSLIFVSLKHQPVFTHSWNTVEIYWNGVGVRGREKAMAPHSSTLAWKIPWMEEPGRLQSLGSLRVGHDWVTSLSLFTFMHWRRKWQPTPVFLPGESQGCGSLVGCCLWGRTESDMTEVT